MSLMSSTSTSTLTSTSSFDIDVETLREFIDSSLLNNSDVKLLKYNVMQLAQLLRSDLRHGLDGSDFEIRSKNFGRNYVSPPSTKSFLRLCFDAMKDMTLIILLISSITSIILNMAVDGRTKDGWIDGAAIFVSMSIVVIVSAWNDWNKSRQFAILNAVKDDVAVSVIRHGRQTEISIHDVLVGDIIELSVGDTVPADCMFVDGSDLKINESSLTGECDDVAKGGESPILYSGTQVMEGFARGIVLAVGEHSQQGIIKALIAHGQSAVTSSKSSKKSISMNGDNCDETTPLIGYVNGDNVDINSDISTRLKTNSIEQKAVLQGKLEVLAIQIGKFGTFSAVLTVVGLIIRMLVRQFVNCSSKNLPSPCGWHKELWNEMLGYFTTGITILVVAIPEGLPLAVTLSLAYSIKRMLRDNNLVRHLNACETMGSATTVCSDKTGTLTTNSMTVMLYWIGRTFSTLADSSELPASVLSTLCDGIAINSSARLDYGPTGFVTVGNKTEGALLRFVQDVGIDYEKCRLEATVERTYTFSSLRKRMSTLVPLKKRGKRLHIKGAAEIILNICSAMITPTGDTETLSRDSRIALLRVIDSYADSSLRTIALAYRDFNPSECDALDWSDVDNVESNLTLIGLFGIEDPVRPEVPKAIADCNRAGITVRMVTGDNLKTAQSIARKCGILSDSEAIVMEGQEFRRRVLRHDGTIDQAAFDLIWPSLRVLARSSPADKLTLVSGLLSSRLDPEHPQVVAVTGDGTNDAPALKRADVGFAMGLAGTSVAKDASDIILMDDNFASIVQAIKWGRNVHDSVSKFIQFQLAVNVVAMATVIVGALTTGDSPLRTVQLLWVNMLMDSLGALALATESPTDALLNRRPYGRNKALLTKVMIRNIIFQASYQMIVIFLILFRPDLFGVVKADPDKVKMGLGTEQYTFLFNAFVFLQIFNEYNSRKLNQLNVFAGIFRSPVFLVISIGSIIVQALLVQYGGRALSCVPLNWRLWAISVSLGLGSFPIGVLSHCFPAHLIPFASGDDDLISNYHQNHFGFISETPPSSEMTAARQRWLRGIHRVRLQQAAVHSWQNSSLSHQRWARIIRKIRLEQAVINVWKTSTEAIENHNDY